jgi:hypothetical protein
VAGISAVGSIVFSMIVFIALCRGYYALLGDHSTAVTDHMPGFLIQNDLIFSTISALSHRSRVYSSTKQLFSL